MKRLFSAARAEGTLHVSGLSEAEPERRGSLIVHSAHVGLVCGPI